MNPFVRKPKPIAEESLGPVVNPDGTPTEVTLRMCVVADVPLMPEWRRRRLADPRGPRAAVSVTTECGMPFTSRPKPMALEA